MTEIRNGSGQYRQGAGSGRSAGVGWRCFFAACPDAVSVAALAAVVALPTGVRPVPPGNWHVTLHFLGSVLPSQVTVLLGQLAAIDAGPLTVEATGLIGLPGSGRARVLAVAVAPDLTLEAWASALSESGPAPDHPFRPHITVGRVRDRRAIPFSPVAFPEPVRLRLLAPALYRSDRDRYGVHYTRISKPPDE